MPFNISTLTANEYQFIGDTEAVTLFRRLTDSTFDGGTHVANAFRMEVDKGTTGGGKAILGKNSLPWLLWASQTGSPVPKIGDVIQDAASVRWTIPPVDKAVDVQAWGTRFLIQTVQER